MSDVFFNDLNSLSSVYNITTLLTTYPLVTLSPSLQTVVCNPATLLHSVLAYHYSLPTVRLSYPEPFIASASFMHYDLWFAHILIYQYWLWFAFITLIFFFFLTFIFTLRWCQIAVRPARETRGVSRSKCGDLITAFVPVSWAASIIIHESTDAIDLFDGFGTAEMVFGIRGFQWGWEYYYPRNLHLTPTTKTSYSSFIGNSIAYNQSSSIFTNKTDRLNIIRFDQLNASNNPISWLLTESKLHQHASLLPLGFAGLDPRTAAQGAHLTRFFDRHYTFQSTLPMNGVDLAPLFFFNWTGAVSNKSFWELNLLSLLKFPELVNYAYNYANLFTNNQKPANPLIFNTYLNPKYVIVNNVWLSPFYKFIRQDEHESGERTSDLYINQEFKKLLVSNSAMSLITDTVVNASAYSGGGVNPFFHWTPQNYKYDAFDYSPNSLLDPSGVGTITTKQPLNLSPLFYRMDFVPGWTFLKTDLIPTYVFIEYSDLDDEVSYWKNLLQEIRYLSESWCELHYWHRYFYKRRYLRHPEKFYSLEHEITPRDVYKTWDAITPQISTTENEDMSKSVHEGYRGQYITSRPEPHHIYKNITQNRFRVGYPLPINPATVLNYTDSFNASIHLYALNLLTSDLNAYNYLPNSLPLNNVLYKQALNTLSTTTPTYYFAWNFKAAFEDFNFFHSNNKNGAIDELSAVRPVQYLKEYKKKFNAFQKVGNPRFNEGNWQSIYSFFTHNEAASPVAQISNINLKNFFTKTSLVYTETPVTSLYYLYNLNANLETISLLKPYRVPFWQGIISLALQHKWIDWYAKFIRYEVLPTASAKYAMFGLPYLHQIFDFPLLDRKEINTRELYFTRIARARRNYTQSWITTSYLYKNSSVASNKALLTTPELTPYSPNSYGAAVGLTFIIFNTFAHRSLYINYYNVVQQPCLLASARPVILNSWLDNLLQTNDYSNLTLPFNINYLTTSYNLMLHTAPLLQITTPNSAAPVLMSFANTLYDVYGNTSNNDWTTKTRYLNSYSRFDYLLQKLTTIRNEWYQPAAHVYLNNLNYLYNTTVNTQKPTHHLEKNQYKQMKRGLTNLIRLQGNGAMALPSEIRIQILASSRDVIHSWAIPSAGVKIDCIPGYSSHKILAFFLSGIFWGQCMEVCGRYHHWMPIIIYFMRPDYFFLWCTHFIYKITQPANTANNQYLEFQHLNTAVFNYNLWLLK